MPSLIRECCHITKCPTAEANAYYSSVMCSVYEIFCNHMSHIYKTKSQAVPVTHPGHAWHLFTSVLGSHARLCHCWHPIISFFEGSQNSLSPWSFPTSPTPPVISWWRTTLGILKLLGLSPWTGPTCLKEALRVKSMLGDNGQSLFPPVNFPNSLTCFKVLLQSHLLMGSTLSNPTENRTCSSPWPTLLTPPFFLR